jgi:hypothetical protein
LNVKLVASGPFEGGGAGGKETVLRQVKEAASYVKEEGRTYNLAEGHSTKISICADSDTYFLRVFLHFVFRAKAVFPNVSLHPARKMHRRDEGIKEERE